MATATRATALLVRRRVTHTIHAYAHDPRTDGFGEEAARALAVPEERLFKTLVAVVDTQLVCAVVPVSGRLSLKALATALGGKRADMADPAAAALAQRSPLPVVIDSTAPQFATVFVSAGKRGLQVELAPADLVDLTSAKVAPIATT
jgi:Cys-tRNA(Pro)/Cys-tRNA(Cys) deacylase